MRLAAASRGRNFTFVGQAQVVTATLTGTVVDASGASIPNSGTFGIVSSTLSGYGARQIQLAMRLRF